MGVTISEVRRERLYELVEELCGGCAYELPLVRDVSGAFCWHWHRLAGGGMRGCGADKLFQALGIPDDWDFEDIVRDG